MNTSFVFKSAIAFQEEDEIDSVNWYVFITYSMPSLKWSPERATFNAFLVASQVRDREEEDDIEGEGKSEGAGDEAGDEARDEAGEEAGDEAGDEAGQCRPEKKLQDLGI